MYARYLKFTISLAILMFFTGMFSLGVLSVTKVWPAHKGLSFKKTACRVTHSEISCESGNCSCSSDGNVKEVPCLKVYVQCGGEHVKEDEVINEKFNFSADKQHEHLLRKDVYHLNDKCSYEVHANICNSGILSTRDLETYRLQRGRPGMAITCYSDPKDPDTVVLENQSKEHYKAIVFHCLLWPIFLIGLSIGILTTTICLCPTRKEYRRMP